ncbi:MAG: DUF433 domain-containing protein [Anaerolineales bacterium]|nr:DUF433 domain-containing protein [Anaerolineales bacterium]
MEVEIAMIEKQLLERIVMNPKVMVGKPVIKGTRLTVEYIVGLLAHGATFDEIMDEYRGITTEDIHVCDQIAGKHRFNKT